MGHAWRAAPGMRAALLALGLGIALFAWALVSAFRLEPVAAVPASLHLVAGALELPKPPAAIDPAAVAAADLFMTDRSTPDERYRMPGEEAPATGAIAEPPRPTVLGTAIVVGGNSFATCQYESPRLLMVRVGDHVGPYVVRAIERGKVVFATITGKTFEVLAPSAGGTTP